MEYQIFQSKLNCKLNKLHQYLKDVSERSSNIPTDKLLMSANHSSDSSSSRDRRITLKEEYGVLLQSDEIVTGTVSQASSTDLSTPRKKRKKKIKKARTIDPLRPTKNTSFGVDIGQGINTVNYLKENCCPLTETKKTRLLRIFTKPVPRLMTEKSLEDVYRQGPLSQDNSTANLSDRKEEKVTRKHLSEYPDHGLTESIDDEIYRIRYRQFSVELSNDYGLDELQSLFVPHHLTDVRPVSIH